MNTRKTLRLVSLAMLIAAIVFVFCGLSNPAWGQVIYIGPFEFGPDLWRVSYGIYAIAMAALFGASFFVKGKK